MNLSSDISKNFYKQHPSSNQVLLSAKEDFELWQEFKLGSKESFSIIYYRYFNDLFNYGLKISGDENITKDCLQEMFTTLWFTKEKLGDVKAIKFYLLKCFRRSLIVFLKKSKKEKFFNLSFSQTQPNLSFSTEDFIVVEETLRMKRERLTKILNSLPRRRKEAIYLKYFKELTYEEIAAVMSLSEKAVINHVYKAFKVIKSDTSIRSGLVSLLG